MSKDLKAAIEANDADRVLAAAKKVKDLNRKMPGANTPLGYAAEVGADRAVEALLDAGAGFPEWGYTSNPWSIARERRHWGVVEALMKRAKAGTKLKARDAATMAMNFCTDNQIDGLRLVMKYLKPRVNALTILYAVDSPRLDKTEAEAVEMLRVLLDGEVDIHVFDEHGKTALHLAADRGTALGMKVLLDAGADVNVRDKKGRTPLMVLAEKLREAWTVRDWGGMKKTDDENRATLWKLADDGVGPCACLRLLVARGADGSLVDRSGDDAMMYYERGTMEQGRLRDADPRVVGVLHNAGAKGDAATAELFGAVSSGDLDAIRKAVKAGADLNHVRPDITGHTPLISAVWKPEVMELLLELGADPNAAGEGTLPIIEAARRGDLAVVKRLVAAGADVNATAEPDEFRDNALSTATINRNFEIADYLKSLGAVRPKAKKWAPIKAMAHFECGDFEDVVAKGGAKDVAEGLARVVGGKVREAKYDQTIKPGKVAYLLVRPKGLLWCNVLRISPPPHRWESDEIERFCCDLARETKTSVIQAGYSDTAPAALTQRFEPGDKPVGKKDRNAEPLDESDLAADRSMKELEALAKKEKFVAGLLGLEINPGREVELGFAAYPAEAFDGFLLVTD